MAETKTTLEERIQSALEIEDKLNQVKREAYSLAKEVFPDDYENIKEWGWSPEFILSHIINSSKNKIYLQGYDDN